MQRSLVIIGIIAAVVVIILANSFYIVRVDKQAIVLQFGRQVAVVNAGASNQAGLHFKIPLVQNVQIYDKRNQGYDLAEEEIIAADQQRLIVDAIARFRILDPLQFYRSAGSMENGRDQLRQRMIAALRGELGKVNTPDIVSGQRAQLMQRIRAALNAQMASFGIEIVDVRIRRADLPQANSERVFERMKAELSQKAALYRAQGEGEAARVRAEADKLVLVTIANANEQAQKVRGEGDAKRNEVYASAYSRDPEFFAFYRSMLAYENSIKAGTPLVLSPDSDFFKYFGSSSAR